MRMNFLGVDHHSRYFACRDDLGWLAFPVDPVAASGLASTVETLPSCKSATRAQKLANKLPSLSWMLDQSEPF